MSIIRNSLRSPAGPNRPGRGACPDLTLLLLAAVSLGGCDGQQGLESVLESEPHTFDHTPFDPPLLGTDTLATAAPFGHPSRLLVLDTFLLVADYPDMGAVHVLDARTGRFMGNVGSGQGEGPGEFTGPPRLLKDPESPEHFWTFDPGQSRLNRFSLADSLPVEPDSIIRLDVPTVVYEAEFIGPSILLALGWFPEGRYAVIDLGGDGPVRFSGALPPLEERDLPAVEVQQAYVARLARAANGIVAIAARNAGRIELIDPASGRFTAAQVPFSFPPDLTYAWGEYRPGVKNRFAYLDVATRGASILGLFSGRLEAAFRNDARQATFVHVFDTGGRFSCALELGTPVTDLAVANKGDRFYGLAVNPFPVVVAFEAVECAEAGE